MDEITTTTETTARINKLLELKKNHSLTTFDKRELNNSLSQIEKRILLQEKATKITRIPVINDKEYKILFYKRIAKKLIRSSTRVFKSRWGFV